MSDVAAFLTKLGIELPIVQAPMAGGPDTPELAAAVSEAGGLGSIGCAYLQPAAIEAAIARTRALSAKPFAVNLFVRSATTHEDAAVARVSAVLAPFRRELGLADAAAQAKPVPSFDDQLEAVLRTRVRVFSFTFGALTRAQIEALRANGTLVIGTATTLEEAEALVSLRVDAVCAQGSEAGGHRGTFLGRFEDALVGTIALTRQVASRLRIPVVAAGGIMDGHGIRAALALGASAVQLGTAFMACPEAGTHPAHKAALLSPYAHRTVVTRAFSGRPARGIRNRMTDAFDAVAPAPFPQQQEITADLRAAAADQSRADLMQLWAGQGAPLIRQDHAGTLVRALAREAGLIDGA